VRVALLTTETAHHAFFARELADRDRLDAIVVEKEQPVPRFPTRHALEDDRDAYERDVLLGDSGLRLAEIADTRELGSVNNAEHFLRSAAVDVAVVFGTTRLSDRVAQSATTACLNLHGGNPEEYRGLDTHLWAVYHRDFENLVTTIHHVDSGIDTGDIVHCAPLRLERGLGLHQLRSLNTKLCLELTLQALSELEAGSVPRRAQRRRGRYYSFMPAVLKDECVEKFATHVATL